jgi:hypothetical protein
MSRLAAVLLALSLSAPAFAATRMTYDINGSPTPIEWAPTAFPLRYEIEQKLAAAHPEAAAMIDRAFAAWASLPGTNVRFESAGIVANTARLPERIAVSLADDLLSDSGAAAVTSYTYDTKTGRMTDADIYVDSGIFKGMNAQIAIQHEVGHVLGLDHSAVISAVMYPYIGSDETPVDFDTDDRIAISTIYPKGDPTLAGATLSGRVLGDQGGIFAAQVVAVNELGQPVGTVLTDSAGEFSISGIPAGRYRLYAEPLDGPVDIEALQGIWRAAKSNSFSTEFFTEEFVKVENGKVYGNLVLTTVGGTVRLNPKWIGVAEAGRPDFSLSTAPSTVRPGQTVNVIVGGDGFTSGMTTFEILNPSFRRMTDFVWADNYVRATYTVESNAPVSSAVILVKSGRESAALTGALRVYRPPSGSKNRAVRH